jgi:hypothetical protein
VRVGGGSSVCDTRARRDAPRAVVHALMKSIWSDGSWQVASGVLCWLAIWPGADGLHEQAGGGGAALEREGCRSRRAVVVVVMMMMVMV